MIVCGASFAGLTVARQLAGSGAGVLVLDRYAIGERQTSACGIPTAWLETMGLEGSKRQEFGELVLHTPRGTSRYELPWTFSTFDYRELCELLWAQSDAQFETAKVDGRSGETVHTDRGDVSAPLIVDALGWRRILATDGGYQPPDAPLSRGLEVHPDGGATISRSGSTAAMSPPATAGASQRAASSASASARSIRASTSRTRPSSSPRTSSGPRSATRATGSPTSSARGPRTASSSSEIRLGTAFH